MVVTAENIPTLLDEIIAAFEGKNIERMFEIEMFMRVYYKDEFEDAYRIQGLYACEELLNSFKALAELKANKILDSILRQITRIYTQFSDKDSPIRQEYIRLLEANGYVEGGDTWYSKRVKSVTHYAWLWGEDRLKMCGEDADKPKGSRGTYSISPDEEMNIDKLTHILNSL